MGALRACPRPDAPINFLATRVDFDVVLTWTYAAGDETGYRIERSSGNSGWSLVADLPTGSTTHTDPGLLLGMNYDYRISTYNACGFSDGYAEATAMSMTPPPGWVPDPHM